MNKEVTLLHMTVWKRLRFAPYWTDWQPLIGVVVLLGMGLRGYRLGEPVFWVDEVATAMRAAGYTLAEVTQQVATGVPLRISDLLQVQQVSRDVSWAETLHALSQSPEHAPLYFVLVRLWAEMFGSSVVALRSLSVVFSLLALPLMGWLAADLFGGLSNGSMPGVSKRQWGAIAPVAMALVAVSPVFVAYAQEARPYSLWTLLLLLLVGALWRSLHHNSIASWLIYGSVLTLSLYTSLLTVLVVLVQAAYVGWCWRSRLRPYLLATTAALMAFLPWMVVIVSHWHTLRGNTTWMQEAIPLGAMLAIWLYNLTVLVFDVPVAAGRPELIGQILIATLVFGVIAYALYGLWRSTPRALGGVVLSLVLSTPGPLILLDLTTGGQTSTAARYFLPCYLGLLLAIAYALTASDSPRVPFPRESTRRWVAAGLLSLCLLSCLTQWSQPPRYQKSRSLSNPAIASLVNQGRSPLLLAEADQMLDVMSLSHQLSSDLTIYVIPPDWPTQDPLRHRLETGVNGAIANQQSIYILNPSERMKQSLEQQQWGILRQVYQPQKLIPGELGLTLWSLEASED